MEFLIGLVFGFLLAVGIDKFRKSREKGNDNTNGSGGGSVSDNTKNSANPQVN